MAQTNFTPILLYGSSTPGNAPVAANLLNTTDGSEIAINVADKNLFFKDSGGVVNTVPIRQSSTSSNGWLSSTDWNTFNNKQPSGSYALTTGTLAQFASTTSAQLAGVISDETGSGSLVFATSPTITTPTISSGNLIFSGTAQRLTGDFSSTTNNGSDRLSLQSSTANGNSIVNIIPNGTATGSQIRLFGNSDLTNASMGQLIFTGTTEFRIAAQITTGSTGTYVPINFYTNNAKQLEILTTGNIAVTTGNLVIGAASKGITTAGATSLGLGTNTSVTQATLFTSGGFSIGNTTDPGAANLSVTGRVYSQSGSNTIANATTQTLFTLATGDVYIVNCSFGNFSGGTTTALVWLPQSGNTAYSGAATLGQNFATFTITVSGASVQITNVVGGSVSYNWTAIKLY